MALKQIVMLSYAACRMKPKRLIINADDCGLSFGITEGILRAHNVGVVTSTSLMANQPATEYAIHRLREFPQLGVGVHLNLSDGRPVSTPSDVPTLVRADGSFYPTAEIVSRLKKWQVSPQEIKREFLAQIQWIKGRGVQPSHVDSHHHVHVYPCAIRAFRRAAKAENIHCTRPLRNTYMPRDGYWRSPYPGRLYRRLLSACYMASVQAVVLHGMTIPDFSLLPNPRFLKSFDGEAQAWMVTLANLGSGTYELGCHPGLPEVGFSELDSISKQRERELQMLTDGEFRLSILSNGFQLANYRDLTNPNDFDTLIWPHSIL
jgi:predicted glycoside hydrolase/deacetylase ChbG (UPF0249 family)